MSKTYERPESLQGKQFAVTRLVIQDFLGVQFFDVAPQGGVTVISGRNGAGKSSVLKAINVATAGKRELPEDPIRRGADRASIVLESPDLTLRWSMRRDRSPELVLESNDGATFRSPRALLDTFLGRLGPKPVDFVDHMTAKQQRDVVADALGLTDVLQDLEAKRLDAYARRTDINRRVKELEAQLAAIAHDPTAPDAEQSVTALSDELNRVLDHERQLAAARKDLERQYQEIERLEESLQKARAAAEISELRIQELEQAAVADGAADDLRHRLQNLEETNRRARARAEHRRLSEERERLLDQAAELTGQVDGFERQKTAAVADAPFPIEDLTLTDDAVLLDGIPLSQINRARQYDFALDLAIACHPDFRAVTIDGGSEIDDDTFAHICRRAEAEGFAVFLTECSRNGKPTDRTTVLMEDGVMVDPHAEKTQEVTA